MLKQNDIIVVVVVVVFKLTTSKAHMLFMCALDTAASSGTVMVSFSVEIR